jgi:hypothetical protein
VLGVATPARDHHISSELIPQLARRTWCVAPRVARQWFPGGGDDAVEVAAVRVCLTSNLCAARAARIIVLVAVRQYQEQGLAHRLCGFAAGAEKAGRLKLAKAVRHAVILDHDASLVSA